MRAEICIYFPINPRHLQIQTDDWDYHVTARNGTGCSLAVERGLKSTLRRAYPMSIYWIGSARTL